MTIRNGLTSTFPESGGIHNAGTLTLNDVRVSDNVAPSGGGIYSTETMTINRGIVSGNRGISNTGGIRSSGPLTINDSIISGNSGSGINSGFTTTIRRSTLSGNTTTGGGGAISIVWGTTTLIDSTVSGNTAGGPGGGIDVGSGNVLNLFNVVISGNVSTSSGGGISNGSTTTLTNVTVSGNSAALEGGGMFHHDRRSTLNNVTFSGNSAPIGGGLMSDFADGVTVKNSIFADNIGPDCSGFITSAAHNLIENNDCTIVGNTIGNIVGVDALLGPLQDNGGPTQTHALLAGSPAIDMGNPAGCTDAASMPLLTDQRGEPRPLGPACDIGAFEGTACTDTIPPDQGNVLRALKSDPDVVLAFMGAPATRWRVYRDADKEDIGSTELSPALDLATYTDAGAVSSSAGGKLFYDVKGLSPCSLTPGP